MNVERSGVQACVLFFFKQKTAYEIKECDWSSDVCSSDLSWLTATYVSSTTSVQVQTADVSTQTLTDIDFTYLLYID